jgi:hypothetical protein
VKKPRDRGKPLDEARFAAWLESFAGYRSHISRTKIENWIAQFTAADNDLAARVLDAVEFYRPDKLENAYSSILGKLPGWSRVANEREGRWRFVPFTMRPGESGDMMLSVFRTANKLNTKPFDELFVYKADLLKEDLGPGDTVVFVDDFAGSGDQAVTAWDESLEELLPGKPKTFLILVSAIQDAITRIATDTPLKVHAYRHLRASDNFFANACSHFSRFEKQRVLHYCERANADHPRGYGSCGLLIVMAHRCPNNSLPILHSKRPTFRGLFPR